MINGTGNVPDPLVLTGRHESEEPPLPYSKSILGVLTMRVKGGLAIVRSQRWFRTMAKLGVLKRHPERANPTTLDELATAYLSGQRSSEYPWLSPSTLERRSQRELPIGAGADHMTRYPTSGAFAALGPNGERAKRKLQRAIGEAIC